MDELRGFNKCYVSARNGCGCLLALFAVPVVIFVASSCFLESQIARIRQGMTKEQVMSVLGEPDARSFDRTWVYGQKDCFIDFEEDGTVKFVHRFGL